MTWRSVLAPGHGAGPEPCSPSSGFANVSHLVLDRHRDAGAGQDRRSILLAAAFPPGSITGAPKVQAMKVIAELEPPRGPFFGSLFWAGFDGAFDSSVLIRTAAFDRDGEAWRLEARAGGGIVADSDPVGERLETEAKIAAVLAALGRSLRSPSGLHGRGRGQPPKRAVSAVAARE